MALTVAHMTDDSRHYTRSFDILLSLVNEVRESGDRDTVEISCEYCKLFSACIS